jgi:glycerol kinase
MASHILAIDQGTTSSRAIIFNSSLEIIASAQEEFEQFFPQSGWVEHDPNEIWSTTLNTCKKALENSGLAATDIASIGITNQRETTILWDKKSGTPVHKAIVWQDRRTTSYCAELSAAGHDKMITEKTGLLLDSYFSGTKIKWILDNVEGSRKKAEEGKLAFGTIDSWLIWKLTDGKKHITDVTNASRTLLFNIHEKKWDDEILKLLDIPKSLLPDVKSSSEIYTETSSSLFNVPIPIAGIAGDQQSALFGQMCTDPGMLKNTYGTGGFLVLNTGNKPITSKNNLLTTIAWEVDGKITYALEGSIFIAGAVVQWLRDGLGLIKYSEEVEELANSVDDNGGVYLVPAFTGLGAPHWDQFARGSISGLTRGTTSGHIARAALEAIAFQTVDVLKAMESDSGIKVTELRVDGGATANDLLMQFQSDILGIPIVRPKISETTALGVAYLAGLAVGYWDGHDDISNQWEVDKRFEPQMSSEKREELLNNWNKAVGRSKNWLK